MSNDTQLSIRVDVDTSTLGPGMAQIQQEVERTAARTKTAMATLPPEIRKTAYSFTEARHAAVGFGEEVGVHLPRTVSSFLAHSKLIGPALAAAFTPIALIAIGEIVVDVAKKMFDLYQNTYNLKGAFEELDAIGEKMIPTQIELSNSIIKLQTELLNLSEGGVVGAKAKLAALGNEIVNLQPHFETMSEKFKELPVSVQEAFKSHTIFPAKEIGAQISEVENKITHLTRAQRQLEEHPQAEIFGKGTLETSKAQLQAYSELLELLTLEQQKLGLQTSVATQQLQKQLGEFSKSGLLAAKRTIAFEFKPPDLGTLNKTFDLLSSQINKMTELDRAAMVEVGLTADQLYDKMANDAVKAYAEIQKTASDQVRDAVKNAQEALKAANTRYEGEYRVGLLTTAQLGSVKQAALDKEYAAERRALETRLNTLSPMEVDARRRVDEQLQELDLKHAEETKTIAQQTADEQMKAEKKIEDQFNRTVVGMINVQESFGKTMEKVLLRMVDTSAEAGLQILEQELVTGKSERLDSAKTAAAKTMAAVPFPFNLIAAPAVFAATLAFKEGGIVPADNTLAMLHAREMVLPAHIADKFTSGGGGSGGGSAVHLHIHALDAKDMQDWIARGGGNEINRHLKRALRTGGLR